MKLQKKTTVINITQLDKSLFLALSDHFDQGKEFIIKRRNKTGKDNIFLIVNEEILIEDAEALAWLK